jgi:hypothetical protein
VDLAQLQAQRRLTVQARYQTGETSFDVFAGGQLAARATQAYDRPRLRRAPFTILAGPTVQEPVALVAGLGQWGAFDVQDLSGAPIGAIRGFPKGLAPARWEIHQPGAPTVTGAFHGSIVKLLRVLSTGLTLPIDYILPFKYRFTTHPSQQVARLSRRTGLRDRLSADLQVPWLDRRLVIAQVIALSRFTQNNLRSDLRAGSTAARSIGRRPTGSRATESGAQETG